MASQTSHIAIALLCASIVVGNPIAASSSPTPSNTCSSVQPCVNAMKSWTDSPSYCSSILKITPVTTTTTVPGTTTTTTLPASSVTAVASTKTVTLVKTVTVCRPKSTSKSNAKRAVTTTTTTKTTTTTTATTSSPIPSQLKSCTSSDIPRACSCLSLTTSTVTSTKYSDSTVTQTPTPATKTITPPVVTSTSTVYKTLTVGGTGTPTQFLTHPTPITSRSSDGNASDFYDDAVLYLPTLPWNVSLYGTNTSTIAITIDGWLALVTDKSKIPENSGWINEQLPAPYDGVDSKIALPDLVYVPYWNELDVHPELPQGVSYQIDGAAGSRTILIEWIVAQYSDDHAWYQFIVTLYEAVPGAALFTYLQMAPGPNPYQDSDRYGTVGVQKYSNNKFAQYAYDQAIPAGTQIYYNPSTNKWEDRSTVKCPA